MVTVLAVTRPSRSITSAPLGELVAAHPEVSVPVHTVVEAGEKMGPTPARVSADDRAKHE